MKFYRLRAGRLGCFLFISLFIRSALFAERFSFVHVAGDSYRVVSSVNEDVYIDRTFSHHAEILNRIAVKVSNTENGSGSLEALFQTSEKSEGATGNVFQWSQEYESKFLRDPNGKYTIDKEYWMPVVRDVPCFPERELEVGASWSEPGEEVHDFRNAFDIAEPYRIPFMADYRFEGDREYEGENYAVFTVSYRIYEEPAPPTRRGTVWPVRIMGASDQTIYWDREWGQPAAYDEVFRIILELSNGHTVEYRGTAKAEIVEAAPMDRGKIADEIAEDIVRLGIADTAVRVTDEGVAISLEDIGFLPDSAELIQSEKTKLDSIVSILSRYPDRDILVGGHTALAGTEAGRQKLSEERATAVAAYIIELGARTEDRVVVRGYGATKPIADNATEEGKRRNRRVEITILEN